MEHYVEKALIEDIRTQEKLRTEEFITILDNNEKYFDIKIDDERTLITISFTDGLKYISKNIVLKWIDEYELSINRDTYKRTDIGIRFNYDYTALKSYIAKKLYDVRNLLSLYYNSVYYADKINKYVARLPFWQLYERIYFGDNHQRSWLFKCILVDYDVNEIDLLFRIEANFRTEKISQVLTYGFSNIIVYDGMRNNVNTKDIRNHNYQVVWLSTDHGYRTINEISYGNDNVYYTKHWYDTFNRNHYHVFDNILDLQKYFMYNLYRSTQEQEIITRSNEYQKFRRLIYDSRTIEEVKWIHEGYDMITVIKILSVSTLKIPNIKHFPTDYDDCIRFLINQFNILCEQVPLVRKLKLQSRYIYLSDWQYNIIETNKNRPTFDHNFVKIIKTDENEKPIYNIFPSAQQGMPGSIIDIPTGDLINQSKEIFFNNVHNLATSKYEIGNFLSSDNNGIAMINTLQNHVSNSEIARVVQIDNDAKFRQLLNVISMNGEIKRKLSDEFKVIKFNKSYNLEYYTYNDRLYQIYLYNKLTMKPRTIRNGSAFKILNISLLGCELINQSRGNKIIENGNISDLSKLNGTILYWGSVTEDGAKYLNEYYENIKTVCIGDNAVYPNLIGKIESVTYTGSPMIVISDINVWLERTDKDLLKKNRNSIKSIVRNCVSSNASIIVVKIQYPYSFLDNDIGQSIADAVFNGDVSLVSKNYLVYYTKVGGSPAISSEFYVWIIKIRVLNDGDGLNELVKRGWSNSINYFRIDIYASLKLIPTCGVNVKPTNILKVKDLWDKQVEPGDLIVNTAEYGSIDELIGYTTTFCPRVNVKTTNLNGIISCVVSGFADDIRLNLFRLHNTIRYNVNSMGINRSFNLSNLNDVVVNRTGTNSVRYISKFRRYVLKCIMHNMASVDKGINDLKVTFSIGGGNYNEVGIVGNVCYIWDINTRDLGFDIPNLNIIRQSWNNNDDLYSWFNKQYTLFTLFDSWFIDSSYTNDQIYGGNGILPKVAELISKNVTSRWAFSCYVVDIHSINDILGSLVSTDEEKLKLIQNVFRYINDNGITVTHNIIDVLNSSKKLSDIRYSFGTYSASPVVLSDRLEMIFENLGESLYSLNINITDLIDCNHVQATQLPNSVSCVENLLSMFIRAYYVHSPN